MHITYGIIYYFLVCVLAFSCTLPLLLVKRVRHRLVNVLNKYEMDLISQLIGTILYFIFAVLIAVLFDAAWTFNELEFLGQFEKCASQT